MEPLTEADLVRLINDFDLMCCPNNDEHRIRAESMPIHLENCPDRDKLTDYVLCPIYCKKYVQRRFLFDHITLCKAQKDLFYRNAYTQTPPLEELRLEPGQKGKDAPDTKVSLIKRNDPTSLATPPSKDENNPVNQLQEHCTRNSLAFPLYSDMGAVSGQSHSPIFQASVTCAAGLTMVAYGYTKKEAKKEAARLALMEIEKKRAILIPQVHAESGEGTLPKQKVTVRDI